MLDVVVIGAGPVGLACGIEAKRAGLTVRILDKGALVNSLLGYPTNMEFFSTPDLLEIGGHPFPTFRYKPIREEAIDYYRKVAEAEVLELRLFERVMHLTGTQGNFLIHTEKGTHGCRNVVVATGFFDLPNFLNVPGEDLPKVTHYFKEPYAYTGQRVAVVGAKNSAAKAALLCNRHGADVTLVVRGPELSNSIKYWLKPDLENRIKEGAIRAYFNTTVTHITEETLSLQTPEGLLDLPNDRILAMTGYRPDFRFLADFGIDFASDEANTPIHNPDTFETNRQGLYLAGTVCGGLNTSRWFIENGRFHAACIMNHIASRAAQEYTSPSHPS